MIFLNPGKVVLCPLQEKLGLDSAFPPVSSVLCVSPCSPLTPLIFFLPSVFPFSLIWNKHQDLVSDRTVCQYGNTLTSQTVLWLHVWKKQEEQMKGLKAKEWHIQTFFKKSKNSSLSTQNAKEHKPDLFLSLNITNYFLICDHNSVHSNILFTHERSLSPRSRRLAGSRPMWQPTWPWEGLSRVYKKGQYQANIGRSL